MRATITSAKRGRRLVGIGLASVLVLSILGVGAVAAANPTWTPGYGTSSTGPQPGSGASSTSVSSGKKVGFFEWLRNDDTSNISQLFLTAIPRTAASLGAAKWTIQSPSGATVRSGTCPTKQPFKCGFGALNAGNTVYVVLSFTAPNLTDGGSFFVDFEWNTTGTPPGNNQSHGDALPWTDKVIVSSNGDAAGDFNIDATSFTVADNQKLTGQNRQATSASISGTVPVIGLTGIAVGDGANLQTPCDDDAPLFTFPEGFSCSDLTSLTSVVEVGNGKTFTNASGGPGIKVLVSFSQMPNQLGDAGAFVYHYWETLELAANGITTIKVPHAELITAACTYNAGNLPTNSTPCLTVGNKIVTVWLFHNGPMKF
jgi:hypothetical protein